MVKHGVFSHQISQIEMLLFSLCWIEWCPNSSTSSKLLLSVTAPISEEVCPRFETGMCQEGAGF
jgi:hypothetical protein